MTGGYLSAQSTSIGDVNSSMAFISGGTLNAGTTLKIGDNGSGMLTISGSAVVEVGGGSGTVVMGQISSTQAILNIGSGTSGGTLLAKMVEGYSYSGTSIPGTVNFSETGSYTFAPVFSGNLNVNQAGAGTTILVGSSTYNGKTTISMGSLVLGVNNAVTGTSTIVFAGGTLGLESGVSNVTGSGVLLLTVNSIITFSGNNVLSFADSSAQSWSTGRTLSIYGWNTTDTLSFGSNSSALTSTQLSDIIFYGDTGITRLGTAEFSGVGGNLTYAVPEPATWFSICLGATFLFPFLLMKKGKR